MSSVTKTPPALNSIIKPFQKRRRATSFYVPPSSPVPLALSPLVWLQTSSISISSRPPPFPRAVDAEADRTCHPAHGSSLSDETYSIS